MQVILKKDIPNIGRIGELVKVRAGYARNFLIPRSLAVAADAGNMKGLEHQKRVVDFHKKKVQKESESVAATMKGVQVSILRKFNEAGKMFGSISASDVASALTAQGYAVDRKDVDIPVVKAAGSYSVQVRLPGDVFASVSLSIEAEVEKEAAEGKAKAAKGKGRGPKKAKEAKAEEPEVSAETDSAEVE